MSSRPSASASTLAISVLPTPASPSRNRGRCMASERNSEVARLRSATYSPAASSACVSSMEAGEVLVCARGMGGAFYNCAMASRRRFIGMALALAAGPLAAQDKPAARVFRVGMLETTPLAGNEESMAELRRGLKELGYAEGHNLELVYRTADGRAERFAGLAGELVRE